MYLIPEVKYLNEDKTSSFLLNSKTSIIFDPSFLSYALKYGKLLKDCIRENVGLDLSINTGNYKTADIFISIDSSLGNEEYTISVNRENIFLKAKDNRGILYAIYTLCQIIEQEGGVLPLLEIKDSPDFQNRGYYLDQSRGRVLTLDFLKKMASTLSRYKINQLQLYIEHTYLFRDLSEMWRDETPLTAEDIMELDRYCKELNIELVPSLSSFGHLFTLLNTKSFNKYCEKERDTSPFSFYERMNHHTVNVTEPSVLPFIKSLIEEYMKLFSSNKFNFCADETFDLGKGKSKAKAEEVGVHRIYIDYVKELANFIVAKGKVPMFWGDIIVGEPELVKELPEDIVCLNWGYAPEQNEEPSRKMAETGVKQYLCPGVCGWNQWINLIENSYKNITRMCNFAHKYNAIGILNTDWGDFGHINHVQYSLPSIIYGANFSWSNKEISFKEINKRLSKLEYKDSSESLVDLMDEINKNTIFDWCQTVFYYENKKFGKNSFQIPPFRELKEENNVLNNLEKNLLTIAISLDTSKRYIIQYLDNTIQGIRLWNCVGDIVKRKEESKSITKDEAWSLSSEIEQWFMEYKELWRTSSKEGDLKHVGDIVFWYCNMLREL